MLVRTGIAVGAVEGLAEVAGQGVGGGDGAGSGLDFDGAMAAGGADGLLDRPAGRLGLVRRSGTMNASGCCGRVNLPALGPGYGFILGAVPGVCPRSAFWESLPAAISRSDIDFWQVARGAIGESASVPQ